MRPFRTSLTILDPKIHVVYQRDPIFHTNDYFIGLPIVVIVVLYDIHHDIYAQIFVETIRKEVQLCGRKNLIVSLKLQRVLQYKK